jgi:hypothetical protein
VRRREPRRDEVILTLRHTPGPGSVWKEVDQVEWKKEEESELRRRAETKRRRRKGRREWLGRKKDAKGGLERYSRGRKCEVVARVGSLNGSDAGGPYPEAGEHIQLSRTAALHDSRSCGSAESPSKS